MTKYPEHDKLHAVAKQSQIVGEFLEWLRSNGIEFGLRDAESDEFVVFYDPIENTLADYFGINTSKLEDEKQALLEECRQEHTKVRKKLV